MDVNFALHGDDDDDDNDDDEFVDEGGHGVALGDPDMETAFFDGALSDHHDAAAAGVGAGAASTADLQALENIFAGADIDVDDTDYIADDHDGDETGATGAEDLATDADAAAPAAAPAPAAAAAALRPPAVPTPPHTRASIVQASPSPSPAPKPTRLSVHEAMSPSLAKLDRMNLDADQMALLRGTTSPPLAGSTAAAAAAAAAAAVGAGSAPPPPPPPPPRRAPSSSVLPPSPSAPSLDELEAQVMSTCPDPAIVRAACLAHGVPPHLRRGIWACLLGISLDGDLLASSNKLDLPMQPKVHVECLALAGQLGASNPLSASDLELILTAYYKRRNVQYSPWLAKLLGTFAVVFQSRGATFNALCAFGVQFLTVLPMDPKDRLTQMHKCLHSLLQFHDPLLCRKLDALKSDWWMPRIESGCVPDSWLEWLFAGDLPASSLCPIMDQWLLRGPHTVFSAYLSVALLRRDRELLCELEETAPLESGQDVVPARVHPLALELRSSVHRLTVADEDALETRHPIDELIAAASKLYQCTPVSFNRMFQKIADGKAPPSSALAVGAVSDSLTLNVEPDEYIPPLCLGRSIDHSAYPGPPSPLRYFVVDCRSIPLRRAGRFPTVFHVDVDVEGGGSANTSIMARLQRDATEASPLTAEGIPVADLLAQMQGVKGTAYVCIMGTGVYGCRGAYRPAIVKKAIDMDRARIRIVVDLFVQAGFPYVCVARGGFSAAYDYIKQTPEFGLEALVDYDPEQCPCTRHYRLMEFMEQQSTADQQAASRQFSMSSMLNALKPAHSVDSDLVPMPRAPPPAAGAAHPAPPSPDSASTPSLTPKSSVSDISSKWFKKVSSTLAAATEESKKAMEPKAPVLMEASKRFGATFSNRMEELASKVKESTEALKTEVASIIRDEEVYTEPTSLATAARGQCLALPKWPQLRVFPCFKEEPDIMGDMVNHPRYFGLADGRLMVFEAHPTRLQTVIIRANRSVTALMQIKYTRRDPKRLTMVLRDDSPQPATPGAAVGTRQVVYTLDDPQTFVTALQAAISVERARAAVAARDGSAAASPASVDSAQPSPAPHAAVPHAASHATGGAEGGAHTAQ